MKSVFITNSLSSNHNTEILSMLLNFLSGDLTVRSVLPYELLKTIKRELWRFDCIIISGEFSSSDEFNEVYSKYLDGEQLFSPEGEFSGCIAKHKASTLAVLPKRTDSARMFIEKNFSPANINYGFEHSAGKTVYVASTDVQSIKQTIAEFENTENPTVTVKIHKLYTEISVTAFGNSKEMAASILTDTVEKISLLLGDDVFSSSTPLIEQTTINLLINKNLKISTAESCTGGQISKMITAVPNSSSIFEIGIASYSNRIKQHALSVPKEVLQSYGAISKQTAAYMALGAKRLGSADIGIGITGVAGPSSSEGHPVGTVFIALSAGNNFWVRKLELSPLSTRSEVRDAACFTAFDLIRRYAECYPRVLPDGSTDINDLGVLYEQPHYVNSSLLFMKEDLGEYLEQEKSAEEIEKTEITEEFDFNSLGSFSTSSTPLEALRKKVIKEHRVKPKFQLPDIKTYFINLRDRMFTTTDIKGFILEYFYKISVLVLVSAMILVSVMSVNIFTQISENRKAIEEIRPLWSGVEIKNTDGMLVDFKNIQKINGQIGGWLSIPNSNINNPVCNFTENEFYSTHNHKDKSNDYGSLYYAFPTDTKVLSKNTVIYGSNATDGSLFADLIKYKNHNFAKNSQIITFATPYDISYYQVFSVMITTDNPAHDTAGNYFDYTKTEFETEIEFNLWVSEAKLRSIYDCSISVGSQNSLLTLVTDTEDFSSSKLVVIARKLETTPDAPYTFAVNTTPKFPAVWYRLHKLENPYVYYISQNTDN